MNATLITNTHGSTVHDSTCPALKAKVSHDPKIVEATFTKCHEVEWAIKGRTVTQHTCLHVQLRRSA